MSGVQAYKGHILENWAYKCKKLAETSFQYSSQRPRTHAICVVSLLFEQAALVVEKSRFRHSRLDKLFQWLHVVAAV
jgi:hypothetical protein